MASSGAIQLETLKTQLYQKLTELTRGNNGRVFHQDDFFDTGVFPPGKDMNLLLRVTQKLGDEKYLKLVRENNAVAWQYRNEEDAKKYRGLSHEQEMVYSLIDEAGGDGIWSKTIKNRSNLHDTTMRAALKQLESKHLIKDMKSVEHPTRKMYIKSSIRQAERTTGGPWYTDSELDEEFIEMIGKVLENFIWAKSFYKSSSSMGAVKKPRKRIGSDKKMGVDEAKAARDAALEPRVKIEEEEERQAKRQRSEAQQYLPLPPGYQNYPTLNEMTRFIENSNCTDTTLTHDDIQQLLDVLCFDKKIEQVVSGSDGVAYKALKKTAEEMENGPMNGLTEAPCGRCPVFELCEEGGPVGPSNCEYFSEWLL